MKKFVEFFSFDQSLQIDVAQNKFLFFVFYVLKMKKIRKYKKIFKNLSSGFFSKRWMLPLTILVRISYYEIEHRAMDLKSNFDYREVELGHYEEDENQ